MFHVFKDIFHQASSNEKYITVNKQSLFLNEKEQRIFKETLKFEKKHADISSFDYLYYDFQIFCDFLEKYKTEFEINYVWDFHELLENFSLVMRFLKIWYYEPCWIYIRKTFEEWLKLLSGDAWNKNVKSKLKIILNLRISEIWPMIFDLDEVYKLYKYLSEKYTHNHWNITDIKFDWKKYLEIEWISVIIIITICNITIQMAKYEAVEKHWNDKIENPIDWYPQYCSYIWPLITSWFISWPQFRFENMLKYTSIQDFDFGKQWKWLNLYKWIYDYKKIETSDIKYDEKNN